MSFLSKPNPEGGEIRLFSRNRFSYCCLSPFPFPCAAFPASDYSLVPEEEESLLRRCWLAGAE